MFYKIFIKKSQSNRIVFQNKNTVTLLGKVSTNTFGKPGGKGEGKRPNVYSMGM